MALGYVALDVETSGLKEGCVLSIGLIVDRLGSRTRIEDLPQLNIIVGYEQPVHGEPVALAMNHALLSRIYNKAPAAGEELLPEDKVADTVQGFLRKCKTVGTDLVLAGKNPTFDSMWLETIAPGIKWHRRTIDPTILYLKPSDTLPPNLATCMERAGIPQPVQHDALEDAMAIVKLIRKYFENTYTT